MLTAFISAAVFGITIDCSDVNTDRAKNNQKTDVGEISSWPIYACRKYEEEYNEVKLSVTSRSGPYKKNLSNSDEKPLGHFTVGEIRAGRTKIVWESIEPNRSTKTLWLHVVAKKETWVFKKNLAPETRIRRSHIRKKLVDVASMSGIQELSTESPVGKATTRSVKKGQMVSNNLISLPPLIKRNDEINVVASNTGLQIKTRGTALETGWHIGEIINVKINGATDSVRAVVTGEKTANVEI